MAVRSKAQWVPGLEKLSLWRDTPERQRQRAFLDELRQAWLRVAVNIVHASAQSRVQAIGVTSATRGEGRTTSSIGLAAGIARETSQPVVLVDADLRKPSLAAIFGLSGGYGLDDYLENLCTFQAAFAPTPMPNLTLMPVMVPNARLAPSPGAPFVFRHRLPSLMAMLREQFAYVVLDLPPLLQDANTGGIASELDGVVLITRSGVTQLQQLQEGVEFLHGARLLATASVMPPSIVPSWAKNLFQE